MPVIYLTLYLPYEINILDFSVNLPHSIDLINEFGGLRKGPLGRRRIIFLLNV